MEGPLGPVRLFARSVEEHRLLPRHAGVTVARLTNLAIAAAILAAFLVPELARR